MNPSNKDRSGRFFRVSLVYAQMTGLEKSDDEYESLLVRDMLADIMHFCDEYAVDFQRELQAGTEYYINELSDEAVNQLKAAGN